jgi:translation initiation factor IF-1
LRAKSLELGHKASYPEQQREYNGFVLDTTSSSYRMPKRIWSTTKVKGKVIEFLPSTNFVVELESGERVLGFLMGPTSKFYLQLQPGDRVRVQLHQDEPDKGKIIRVYRRAKPSTDDAGNSEESKT